MALQAELAGPYFLQQKRPKLQFINLLNYLLIDKFSKKNR